MTAVSINKHSSRSHLRLNQISRGTEFLFAVILGLFALLCIIPFVFVAHGQMSRSVFDEHRYDMVILRKAQAVAR